ncbi:MAG TPA: hypothetical protein VMF35_11560 [Acidimicrobiales bacterium]|nr:hypothetical protein [Acidimicrobiales bacterium]
MSRGLGPQQLRLLELLDDEWRREGLRVCDVPALLGVEERRGRAIVTSLVERALVKVVDDPVLGRRVWSPERLRVWQRDVAVIRAMIERIKNPVPSRHCTNCGARIDEA